MTLALPRAGERSVRHIDLSGPVIILLALFLCGLVLLPLGWLVWYSVIDNEGAPTVLPRFRCRSMNDAARMPILPGSALFSVTCPASTFAVIAGPVWLDG